MEYDKYKEQVENNVRPTVPQMAQQQTQTSVPSIDDDNNEFFEYEGERVRVFVPSTSTILPDKEDLKQAYNTVLKNSGMSWDMVENFGCETMRHFISKGIKCGRCGKTPGRMNGDHHDKSICQHISTSCSFCKELGFGKSFPRAYNHHDSDACGFKNMEKYIGYIYRYTTGHVNNGPNEYVQEMMKSAGLSSK